MAMKFGALHVIVAVCLLAGVATVRAQSVLGSPPSAPLVPSSLRDASDSSPFSLPTGVAKSSSPFHWGPVAITPHFSDDFTYSDGLQAAPGHPANSYINSFSAGVLLDLGSHWTLDYTPTWVTYTNRTFKNSVNQAFNLGGGKEFGVGDWLLQLSQAYSSDNVPLIETGRQTSQESFGTTLSTSHRFGDRWSFALSGTQNLQFVHSAPNNYDWSTQAQLAYSPGTRLQFSLSYQWGFTDYDPGAYMTHAQSQAGARWRVTDKLALSIQGGGEQSQVHKTGIAAQKTPTWSMSAQYQPFDYTTLSLGTSRSVSPSTSTFANGVTNTEGWTAEVGQRLLGHFAFSAGLAWDKTHFSGSHTALIPDFTQTDVLDDDGNIVGTITNVNFTPTTVIDLRNDSTHSFHVGLSTTLLKRVTIAVSYVQTRNISDTPGFGFTSHQIGGNFGFRW
jgi:hypothetical protein